MSMSTSVDDIQAPFGLTHGIILDNFSDSYPVFDLIQWETFH